MDEVEQDRSQTEEETPRSDNSSAYDRVRDELWSFATQHPTLIVSAVAILVLVLRLMQVSRGNPTTASALLTTAGPLEVGVGVLVTMLPLIIMIAIAYGVVAYAELIIRRRPLSRRHVAILWLLPWALLLLSLYSWLLALLLGALWAVTGYAAHRKQKDESMLPDLSILVVLVAVSLNSQGGLWMPSEHIKLADGNAVVGYVVEMNEWTTVLRDQDRVVLRIETDEVVERTPCVTEGSEHGRTVSSWIREGEQPVYPDCESL